MVNICFGFYKRRNDRRREHRRRAARESSGRAGVPAGSIGRLGWTAMIQLNSVSKTVGRLTRRKRVISSASGVFHTRRDYVVIAAPKAGKSTLLRLLCGLTTPTKGRIVRRGKVSLPLGAGHEFSHAYSLRELATLYARRYGADPGEVAKFAFRLSDLEKQSHLKADDLPGALRRQFYFALGYAIPADIYLIDEAYSFGDEEFRARCAEALAARRKTAGTILATSKTELARSHGGGGVLLSEGALTFYEDVEEAISSLDEARLKTLFGTTAYSDALAALGRHEEVMPYLWALIEDNPENSELYANLAEAAIEQEQTEIARLAAEMALHQNPNLFQLHLLLGKLAEKAGDSQGVIENLSRFIEKNPRDTRALSTLAQTYEKAGAFMEAAKTWRLLAANGNSLAPRLAVRASMRAGDWRGALRDVEQSMAHVDDHSLIETKATILLEMGDYDEFARLLKKNIDKDLDFDIKLIAKNIAKLDATTVLEVLESVSDEKLGRVSDTRSLQYVAGFLNRHALLSRRDRNTALGARIERQLARFRQNSSLA